MDSHQMRIFACVAKYLSETRAAQELHLSQPVISHHLKALQERMGNCLNVTLVGLHLRSAGRPS
jgi:DNA-binding transcriptional LysR family regulator